MQLELTAGQQRYVHFKQVYDFALALVLLLLCLPLMVLLVIWIKWDSKGNVFYAQERPGKHNRLFTLIKFRSMTVPQHGEAFSLTQANDMRLTNAGRWLRKLHLDELPQLINVVLGHMSLVGPRPLPEPLYAKYQQEIPDYNVRHLAKPGLTGFAQIWQGYTTTLEEEALKWKYDLYYLQRMSLKEDAVILWETVFGGNSKDPLQREEMRNSVISNSAVAITKQRA